MRNISNKSINHITFLLHQLTYTYSYEVGSKQVPSLSLLGGGCKSFPVHNSRKRPSLEVNSLLEAYWNSEHIPLTDTTGINEPWPEVWFFCQVLPSVFNKQKNSNSTACSPLCRWGCLLLVAWVPSRVRMVNDWQMRLWAPSVCFFGGWLSPQVPFLCLYSMWAAPSFAKGNRQVQYHIYNLMASIPCHWGTICGVKLPKYPLFSR